MSAYVDQSDDGVPSVMNAMDESLRCKICGDYFRSAVTIASTKCGHSFCSECIRNTFSQQLSTTKRQRRCPQCNYEIQNESKELVKNFALQEAVAAYKTCLPLIHRAVTCSTNPRTTAETAVSQSSHPPVVRPSARLSHDEELASDNIDDEIKVDSGEKTRAARVSIDSDIEISEEGVVRKKPMTNYAGKKKRQLQEMCKHEGLRTDGSEEKLKKRHQDWILFYNAETDAIHPRSERALRQEFTVREKACAKAIFENSARGDSQAIVSLIHSRPMDDNYTAVGPRRNLTSGNPDFDKKLNDNFKAMIEATRARQRRTKDSDHQLTVSSREESNSPLRESRIAEAVIAAPCEVPTGGSTASVSSPKVGELSRVANGESVSQQRTGETDLLEKEFMDKPAPSGAMSYSTPTLQQSLPFKRSSGPQRTSSDRDETLLKRQRRSSVFGPWTCPRCTFYNKKHVDSRAKCEMGCGGSRP